MRRLFPPGVQRGQSVEVRALGNAPTWPVQVWSDTSELVWEPQSEKGLFRVTASATAPFGVHNVRFFDADGATAVQRFLVGCIAEANETEPNDEISKANSNPAESIVWNGVLEKRGEVDVYAFEAAAGQTIVASFVGQQQLRSPMDACLQILSPSGSVLAENHDTIGLDPMLAFTVRRDGKYFVRTFAFPESPDSSIGFAGGDNYVYRLTITTKSFIRGSRPLVASKQDSTSVELFGWNIPDSLRVQTLAPSSDSVTLQWTQVGFANYLELPVSPVPILVETADSNGQPQAIPIPIAITGCIASNNEVDRYRFAVSKDAKLRMQVTSRSLGFPTDPVLRILDPAGKQLSQDDDGKGGIDASLDWQGPADGEYSVEVSDLYGEGSPFHFYLLNVTTPNPDFKLQVDGDLFQGKVGAQLEIPVSISRIDGFGDPIRIAILGLPATIPCEPVVSASEGDTSKAVKLIINAAEKFSGPITIQALSEAQPEMLRMATPKSDELTTSIWLVIRP